MKHNSTFRHFILPILSVFIFSISFSQEDLGTYECEYASLSYDVQINFNNKDEAKHYISCFSLDSSHDNVGFIVDGDKKREDLITGLGLAKLKYQQW